MPPAVARRELRRDQPHGHQEEQRGQQVDGDRSPAERRGIRELRDAPDARHHQHRQRGPRDHRDRRRRAARARAAPEACRRTGSDAVIGAPTSPASTSADGVVVVRQLGGTVGLHDHAPVGHRVRADRLGSPAGSGCPARRCAPPSSARPRTPCRPWARRCRTAPSRRRRSDAERRRPRGPRTPVAPPSAARRCWSTRTPPRRTPPPARRRVTRAGAGMVDPIRVLRHGT